MLAATAMRRALPGSVYANPAPGSVSPTELVAATTIRDHLAALRVANDAFAQVRDLLVAVEDLELQMARRGVDPATATAHAPAVARLQAAWTAARAAMAQRGA